MTAARAAAVGLLALLACGGRAAPAGPAVASLGGDAARVGGLPISMVLVAETARSRGVPPRAALEGLIEDALLAQGAAAKGLGDAPAARWAAIAEAAELVAQRAGAEARAGGAPSGEELATVEVVHAVVLWSPTLAPARGAAIAQRIVQAVSATTDAAGFSDRAQQVAHGGARLTVQRLAAFDASGVTEGGEQIDPSFVAGAFQLRARGQTSDVVTTPFGWHVIRLIERTPSPPSELDRRRSDLADAVIAIRARANLGGIVAGARKRERIETSAGADALMAEAVASAP